MNQILAMPVGSIDCGGKAAHLVHAVEVDQNRQIVRVLCNRVKPDHILNDGDDSYTVDCPVCLKRMAKEVK